ncbi:MAG: hypothetical protein DCF16_18290 [Alphaproteobacteria bacterium]|nr:MAG: hypothetical protein DCF16_18290 [Alphaproteobacteria bacterium]
MSRSERALARMAASGWPLAQERAGERYGVYPQNDRRRHPLVRLSAEEVRALEASGAILKSGDVFVLSAPGGARVRREAAAPGEAFVAQHREVIDRTMLGPGGDVRRVRGHDADAVLRRLAALRDGAGGPWLDAAEVAAAARLRSDWEMGERGLVRGSDWTAPPNASSGRSVGNAAEFAAGAFCDARRRVAEALERLAPPLRRVVERVCLHEEGLEALERAESWPARSGKLALKLALSQLASG